MIPPDSNDNGSQKVGWMIFRGIDQIHFIVVDNAPPGKPYYMSKMLHSHYGEVKKAYYYLNLY
jgi:hypothetical protein